jgi:hypothetical protein
MWEDQYVEYLIDRSKLPRCFSKIGGGSSAQAFPQVTDPRMSSVELIACLKESIARVDRCTSLLERRTDSLKDAEAALKKIVYGNKSMGSNIKKIGDRLVVLGLANLFVVVVLLLVVLVK